MAGKDEQIIIGRYLKEARENCGYIREQVAERVGISVRYLTAIENEEKRPAIDVYFRLLLALGIASDPMINRERYTDISESERLLNLLYTCTPKERTLISAIIDTVIDQRDSEDPSNHDIATNDLHDKI